MKRKISTLLCLALSVVVGLSLIGCERTEKPFNPNDNLDTSSIFFDDFTSGISSDNWEIPGMAWGKGNGGVLPENVGYTPDGVVVLTSNGDYYAGDKKGVGDKKDGTRTGGMLKTRQAFGPGRFETRLKCLPRFGSTTAFWTFYHDGVNANHEIDIELNVNYDFKAVWNTNWLTVGDSYDHYETATEVINNDGEWHIYKFEWHTNPSRIDYYVDDILTHTSYSNIPTYSATLNVGNWFPAGWAGTPDFETDYTFIDWVRYTPYTNNPYDKTPNSGKSPDGDYPKSPMELPLANLISNAQFEGRETAWRKKIDEQKTTIQSGIGVDNSKAIKVLSGEQVHQFITGVSDGFEYNMSAFAKSVSGGKILIQVMPLYEKVLQEFVIDFSTSNEFAKKDLTFKVNHKDAAQLKVILQAPNGDVIYDNLFMNTTKILKLHNKI